MNLDQIVSVVRDLGVTGILLLITWAYFTGRIPTRGEVKQIERFTAAETARADRAEKRNDDLTAAVHRLADQVEKMRELREAR